MNNFQSCEEFDKLINKKLHNKPVKDFYRLTESDQTLENHFQICPVCSNLRNKK